MTYQLIAFIMDELGSGDAIFEDAGPSQSLPFMLAEFGKQLDNNPPDLEGGEFVEVQIRPG